MNIEIRLLEVLPYHEANDYELCLEMQRYSKAELIEIITKTNSLTAEFFDKRGISPGRIIILQGGCSIEEQCFFKMDEHERLCVVFKKDWTNDMAIINNKDLSIWARINALQRISSKFCQSTTPDQLKNPLFAELIKEYSTAQGYSFAFNLAKEGNTEAFNYWVGTNGGIGSIGSIGSRAAKHGKPLLTEDLKTFLIRCENEARSPSMPALTSYSNPILNSLLSVEAIHTAVGSLTPTSRTALTFDVPDSETDFRQKALFMFSKLCKMLFFTDIELPLPERFTSIVGKSTAFLAKFPNISLKEINDFGLSLMFTDGIHISLSNSALHYQISLTGYCMSSIELPTVTASAVAATAMAFGTAASVPAAFGAGGPSW